MRPQEHEVSSLRSKQSQFALHSPLATHLVPRSQPPIEARNPRTRYIIERWSPRADAVARARRRLPSDRWGCRVSRLHFNPCRYGTSLGAVAVTGPPSVVIGRHSRRPSRCLRARRRPHQFGSGQRCRTRWVIERSSRAQASTAKYAASRRIAGRAANAAAWRNRGSLCRCSLRPVRRPAQLAVCPPRRLGGQRHSAANGNFSRSASGAQARAFTWSGQRALAALDMKPPRKPAGQASSFSLGRRSQAR